MKAKKLFLLLIAFFVFSLVGCKNPIDSKDTEPIEMLTSAPMLSAFDVSEALGEKIIDTQYNHDLDEGTVLLKNKIKYTYKREYSVDEFCYTEVLEFEKLNNDTIRKQCYKDILPDINNGRLRQHIKECCPESSNNFGIIVPVPEYTEVADEFEHPTELDRSVSWKLNTIYPCHVKGRCRSTTELLFCMLRSGKSTTHHLKVVCL